jgi:hypothetical protein
MLEMAKVLDPAFHAFNSMRKKIAKVEPRCARRLASARAGGGNSRCSYRKQAIRRIRPAATARYHEIFSEGLLPRAAGHRASRSGWDASVAWLKRVPLQIAKELAHHQTKPDPDVLLEICRTEEVAPEDAAYVGDSIARDMLMAKRGVFAIWAEYGAQHDRRLYADLVRVTHWTPEEVAREQKLKAEATLMQPDYIASSSFLDVLTALDIAAVENLLV